MILIKTYISDSKIHGKGVFSDGFIPKGTIVWKFNKDIDVEIPVDKISTFRETYGEDDFDMHVSKIGDRYFLFTDVRYMNHSEDNNISYHGKVDDVEHNIGYASKDIFPGDELTENYFVEYDPDCLGLKNLNKK